MVRSDEVTHTPYVRKAVLSFCTGKSHITSRAYCFDKTVRAVGDLRRQSVRGSCLHS